MSYLDFWWAVIMETLGIILRKLLPYIIVLAIIILAMVFL